MSLFFSLLTILLIALKLCGVIHCSWWLVLAPLFALVIGTCISLLVILYIATKK